MHPIVFKLKNTTNYLKREGVSDDTLRVFAKESLQNHILHALYSHPQYKEFIFYGGTCLRKIFGLNRMSEDLDFESVAAFSLNEVGNFVSGYFKSLEFEGVDYSVQQGKRISRVTIKFPIMYELGLSSMQSEKLHVKVEINKASAGGFRTELTPIMEESVSTIIKHYPLNTLMASKMLACLERVFVKGDTGVEVKGRDYYDLVWYMQKAISPDEKWLAGGAKKYTVGSAFALLDEKVKKIKSGELLLDLKPMFEDEQFIRQWCKNFHEFYTRYRKAYS